MGLYLFRAFPLLSCAVTRSLICRGGSSANFVVLPVVFFPPLCSWCGRHLLLLVTAAALCLAASPSPPSPYPSSPRLLPQLPLVWMISPLLKWAGTWGLWGHFTVGGGTIQPYLHKEKPYCGELRAVSGPVDSGRLQSSPLTGRQQIAWALVGPAWWGQMAFGGAGALQDACVLTAWRQVREMQCYSVVPLLFCTFPSPCSVLNCDPSFVKDVFVWECLCGWVHPQPQFNLSSEGGEKKIRFMKENTSTPSFIRKSNLAGIHQTRAPLTSLCTSIQ